MSDLLWAAYFVVGGFFAGPIVHAVFEDVRGDSTDKEGSETDGGGVLVLMLLIGALCWLAWPLAYSFKRALDKQPTPTHPNSRSGE